MSFATGLFSFMGGASRQFREEIDVGVARKASAAAAVEEKRRWGIEQTTEKEKQEFEVSKFETEQSFLETKEQREATTARGKILFERQKEKTRIKESGELLDLEELKVANAKADSIADRSLKRDELDFKINSFADVHELNRDKFKLTGEEFTQAKKEFMENMGLSEKEYDLNKLEYDETVRYNKEKIRIEEAIALMEAEEGTTTYRGLKEGDDIKIKFSGETETERLFSSLSQFNGLSNEQIKKLTPESREKLQEDVKKSLGHLKLKSYDDTNKTYMDFTMDYPNLYSLDVLKEVFDDVMNEIKSDAQDNFKKDGIQADSIALSTDGSTISTTAINFDEWTVQAGFKTKEQLLANIDSLIAHNNTKVSFTGELSPFRDREALYMTMKQEDIDFKLLQLSEELNYLQELPMNASVNSAFYTNLFEKAEDLGIIGPNGENVEHVYNFIYKVQPQGEVIAIGGVIQTAITPKEAGRDVDHKAATDQYAAASTAIRTVDEMILRIDSLRDESLFGLPMTAASLFEKAKSTIQGVQLLLGRVQSNEVKFKTESARNKFIDGLNSISETQGLAEEQARIQYLKFSLAYQMSMALQGGSGGRTISDQDVDNMLRALNMDNILGIADADQVKASLGTIRTFMSGIANKAYYQSLNNMKGYRTHRHVVGMMDAMSIDTLEKLAQELEDKVYGVQEDMDTVTSNTAQLIGIDSWDSVATINGIPEFSVFQKDGYPYVEFIDPEKGAYFLTQEMLNTYRQSERGKKSKLIQGIDKIPKGDFPIDLTSLGGRTIQNPTLIGQ
jgi:hypothetical protein